MSLSSEVIELYTKRAASELANWLDDVIAGLLINGVAKDAIEVRQYPNATRVAIHGVERYEFKIVHKVG